MTERKGEPDIEVALASYMEEENIDREEALRRIVRDWLIGHGYLPLPTLDGDPTYFLALSYDPEHIDRTSWIEALRDVGLAEEDYVLFLPTADSMGGVLLHYPRDHPKARLLAKLTFS